MKDDVLRKLEVLSGAAKYDVSCASSGSNRRNTANGIGNASPWGICHSFAEDGRCISLLKIMMTNYCMYDCAYCINRRSNDVERTSLSVEELTELTISFYRRNYIEGLFLSSGVVKSPDHTMSLMVRVAKELRNVHRFNGYIHLKSIPGASPELIRVAGLYADRLSVNIEIPTETNLKLLAPEKDYSSIFTPMKSIHQGILANKDEIRKFRSTPKFVPAGQSTQMIVGATPDNDKQILNLASVLYTEQKLKRVYYSGYVPVNTNDSRLPAAGKSYMVRENRLYQSDWLIRFYAFQVDEIVNDNHPDLDLDIDPKLSYAIRHPEIYPIDINRAPYEMILRVPGIGVKSAKLIIASRRYGRIHSGQLKKMGVVMKRAQYFISCNELGSPTINEIKPENMKQLFLKNEPNKKKDKFAGQLKLFTDNLT
ncbi:putative DNA modification/repair radical SAM protein [Saccharicrinis sp. FJH62]|uniref:putative DNA modification/repair radical SAM protein n=1 Tax=Saccharicrinis sp. FJH62 TaxID=3344657 RepID=UPI0035D4AAD5